MQFLYKTLFLISGFFFLFLFYVFSLQVKNERFKQINFDTTVRLQDNIPARLEEPLEDISFLVSPVLSLFWVGLFTLISLVGIKKRVVYPGALLIPLFFGLMIGAEIVGKSRVESPAPPFFMLKNPTTIFPKYHVQEAYSYPSGHAARSLFFAGLISLYTFKRCHKLLFICVTSIGLGMVVLMSVGKVFLGHHWLSDIVGGVIVAIGFLCFTYAALVPKVSIQRFFPSQIAKEPLDP